MVQLAKQDPTMVYVVLEGDRPIGRVVAPAGEPVLGPGAGTVLLRRETGASQTRRPETFRGRPEVVGGDCHTLPPSPADPHASCPGPSRSSSCRPSPPAAAAEPPSRRRRRSHRRHDTGDHAAADLKARISIFADDSMLGRRAGTLGNVRGNAYIAAELARLGLTPAGDSGGYLQRVPLDELRGGLPPGHAARRSRGSLAPFADYYPYQPTFAVPARPIDGAPGGLHRHPGRLGVAALPRCAQGQGGASSGARPRATRSARPT